MVQKPTNSLTSGVLLLDKPTGMTSAWAVSLVKRALPGKTRVGHTGTLDPLASGLLVLMIGGATRLSRYVGDMEKSYTATAQFGAVSDSLDADGQIEDLEGELPARDDIEAALSDFIGRIEQTPPMASAVKVAGKRLYALHREGKTVEREARTVEVEEFTLNNYDPESGEAEFFVRCGGGTYVRSLVADAAEAVGSGAYLTALRREAVGRFSISDAIKPDAPGRIEEHLLPPEVALGGISRFEVEAGAAKLIGNGRPLDSFGEVGKVALFYEEALIAVYADDGRTAKPEVVLWSAG